MYTRIYKQQYTKQPVGRNNFTQTMTAIAQRKRKILQYYLTMVVDVRPSVDQHRDYVGVTMVCCNPEGGKCTSDL
jgi:hypothetical protein